MNERSTLADDLELREDGKRVPAAERVLDFILAEMDAGRLEPGSRVNAARIAGTLGLSAAPVREALSILAGRGVLELLPDRGAIMRPFSAHQVSQMWEVIAAVGAVGLRLAARAVTTGADTGEIVARYQDIGCEPLVLAPVAFLLRLNGYHWAVHRLGGNEFVTPALERLGVPYWDRYLAELIDIHANIAGYLTNYRRMHEAVMAGDGEAAAAVMHYHADWSIQLIRQRTEREGSIKRRRRKASVP
ncbi:MAG TPA: GntR family transcriptional regulator [Steroidobacteraceae bacterium]|jgi:DNA-binding GntR family transcriptional regulator|nr:GntR family transcriptional regulator [Steroidobacteraceae bacterium]